jgi:hypothetical protein
MQRRAFNDEKKAEMSDDIMVALLNFLNQMNPSDVYDRIRLEDLRSNVTCRINEKLGIKNTETSVDLLLADKDVNPADKKRLYAYVAMVYEIARGKRPEMRNAVDEEGNIYDHDIYHDEDADLVRSAYETFRLIMKH